MHYIGTTSNLTNFEQEMCYEYVEEKKQLLRAIAKDRKLSDLAKISQVGTTTTNVVSQNCAQLIYDID